ncbi:histidine kinase [Shewanella sp. Pdp11]|uniref:EAL and HDOD domain-containing protein n=1 Tax=Shewanella sp. Pdp11 TaxID=2059264 RepID=UPI000CA1949F|nr:HDOD domain-containing protein [Shewanella sp. Pdp11]AUD60709.1 histidine kinase [Shewanella sp. Pdp11]
MRFYMARQPVLNRQKHVVAYELLFRNSRNNSFPQGIADNAATAKLLVNSYLNMDLDDLTEGKPALINFPTHFLSDYLLYMLPHKNIVVEVLETVEPSDENFIVIKQLFNFGYYLALDDFVYSAAWDRFLPFFKLIKVDIVSTPLDSIAQLIPIFRKYNLKLLAEKVETLAEYKQAKLLGFDYFQGYYFFKPELIEGCEIGASQHFILSIYHEVFKPDFSYKKLERYFSQDLDLTYKLLRFVNSSQFEHVTEFTSIKQTMIFLGENRLRKFVSLIILAELNPNKPIVLIHNTMMRARLCEELISLMGFSFLSESAFLTGLLSTLDAILDKPMDKAIGPLPLDQKIKSALLNNHGYLAHCLQMAVAYMEGDWVTVDYFIEVYKIDQDLFIVKCDHVYGWLNQYQRSVQ